MMEWLFAHIFKKYILVLFDWKYLVEKYESYFR